MTVLGRLPDPQRSLCMRACSTSTSPFTRSRARAHTHTYVSFIVLSLSMVLSCYVCRVTWKLALQYYAAIAMKGSCMESVEASDIAMHSLE
jgi:hypothetical protein